MASQVSTHSEDLNIALGAYKAMKAPFIVLNARPGAMHHVTFPVVARTSFGVFGSLWCTFNRGVMACIWVCNHTH
jgi:cytosine/uracil/thiamine/allantoin permease